MPSRCSTVKVCQCPVGALLLIRSVGSGKREQNHVRVRSDTMMMNDEQKLAPSGFANTPSIVPNYTANRRGARINTRPATDKTWKRWATHEGPMRLSGPYTSSHREKRRPSSRLGRKPNFEAQQTTSKAPKHTCLDCNGNESASGTVPTSDRHGSTHLSVFLVASRSPCVVSLKRPKIAVATCKLASKIKE